MQAMRWCLARGRPAAAGPGRRRLLLRPRAGQARAGHGSVRPVGPPADHVRRAGTRLPRHRAAGPRTREQVRFVPHHVAHAASAGLAAPSARGRPTSVLVLDGRGRVRLPPGRSLRARRDLEMFAAQELPHSLGLLYESLTEHLGFLRSSDEYKVMALASYGTPRFLDELREADPRDRRRRLRRRPSRTGRGGPGRAAPTTEWAPDARRPRCVGAGRPGGGAGRAGPLAARAHRRPGPDHGRRHRAELRGQLPDLARDAVRGRVGAAGRRRRRHLARRRAAAVRRRRRAG